VSRYPPLTTSVGRSATVLGVYGIRVADIHIIYIYIYIYTYTYIYIKKKLMASVKNFKLFFKRVVVLIKSSCGNFVVSLNDVKCCPRSRESGIGSCPLLVSFGLKHLFDYLIASRIPPGRD
jgi:hypothetical protein